jgi:hypothetical protein
MPVTSVDVVGDDIATQYFDDGQELPACSEIDRTYAGWSLAS